MATTEKYILVSVFDTDISVQTFDTEAQAQAAMFTEFQDLISCYAEPDEVETFMRTLRETGSVNVEIGDHKPGIWQEPIFDARLFQDHGNAFTPTEGIVYAWKIHAIQMENPTPETKTFTVSLMPEDRTQEKLQFLSERGLTADFELEIPILHSAVSMRLEAKKCVVDLLHHANLLATITDGNVMGIFEPGKGDCMLFTYYIKQFV